MCPPLRLSHLTRQLGSLVGYRTAFDELAGRSYLSWTQLQQAQNDSLHISNRFHSLHRKARALSGELSQHRAALNSALSAAG